MKIVLRAPSKSSIPGLLLLEENKRILENPVA